MKIHTALIVLALGATVAGCTDRKQASTQQAATSQDTSATEPVEHARPARTAPLALPVPITSGAPANAKANAYAGEPTVTPDVVHAAVLKGMGAGAADINVDVKGGMVYLKGTVKNEADFQAANYIARALPGVDEVDQSALKIR